MKNIKSFLICSFILIAACKKSGTSIDAEATLTSGKWQLTDAGVVIPGSSTPIDVFSQVPTCLSDNFYTFGANGTLTVDEGASKCNPGDPQTTTGNWKLLDNNTKLQGVDVTGASNATTTVILLDNNTLKLQDTTTYSGATVTAIATFTHIH